MSACEWYDLVIMPHSCTPGLHVVLTASSALSKVCECLEHDTQQPSEAASQRQQRQSGEECECRHTVPLLAQMSGVEPSSEYRGLCHAVILPRFSRLSHKAHKISPSLQDTSERLGGGRLEHHRPLSNQHLNLVNSIPEYKRRLSGVVTDESHASPNTLLRKQALGDIYRATIDGMKVRSYMGSVNVRQDRLERHNSRGGRGNAVD